MAAFLVTMFIMNLLSVVTNSIVLMMNKGNATNWYAVVYSVIIVCWSAVLIF